MLVVRLGPLAWMATQASGDGPPPQPCRYLAWGREAAEAMSVIDATAGGVGRATERQRLCRVSYLGLVSHANCCSFANCAGFSRLVRQTSSARASA